MKKVLFMSTALLLAQANTAQAIEIEPYAGIGVGLFEMDPGENKKSTIGGFGFVGANLHEYFATEFRAGLTGVHEREELGPLTETFKVNWFVSAFAKPKIEVAEGLELYGLVGVTNIQTAITPLNSIVEATSNNTSLSFGVGGSYRFNDKFTVGMEWVRYSTNADVATKNSVAGSFNGMDVNGFTTTFAYNF